MMAEIIGHHGYAQKTAGRLPPRINDGNDHPCYGIRLDALDALGGHGWLYDRRPPGVRHGSLRHAPQPEREPSGVSNSGDSLCVSAFCSSKGSSRGWASWHSLQRFRRGSVFRFLQKDRLCGPVSLLHTRAFFGSRRRHA